MLLFAKGNHFLVPRVGCYTILLACFAVQLVTSIPLVQDQLINTTIPLPQGTRYIEEQHLLCTPSTWRTIVPFFLLNYFAHIATVKSVPGEPTLRTVFTLLLALLFPASGVARGLNAICPGGFRGKTPLEVACKSGALCVVVRTRDWKAATAVIPSTIALPSTVATAATSEVLAEQNPSRVEDPPTSGQESAAITPEENVSLNVSDDTLSPRQTQDGDVSSSKEVTSEEEHASARDILVEQPMSPKSPTHCRQQSQSAVQRKQPFDKFMDYTTSDEDSSFRPATRWYSLDGRTVHGSFELPRGYALSILPPGFRVSRFRKPESGMPPPPSIPTANPKTVSSPSDKTMTAVIRDQDITPEQSARVDGLNMSWNVSKAVIAVLQTLYASFTLYETRGNQIETFGYAAFGLTVTPYLIMSLVNLTGNIMTPDFQSVYLMRDGVMSEVEERTQIPFDRVVGEVMSATDSEETRITSRYDNSIVFSESIMASDMRRQFHTEVIMYVPIIIIAAAPIVIVAGLTHFNPGHSTYAQRCWITIWLVVGVVIGAAVSVLSKGTDAGEGTWPRNRSESHQNPSGSRGEAIRPYHGMRLGTNMMRTVCTGFLYAAPAIGGLVVVGQMLSAYGDCKMLF